MQVIKPSAVPAEPATSPLFTSEVSRQPILTPEMSQNFNLGIVNFPAGVRNKMHTHSSDQVLFVTEGTGIIATETTQQEITVGDVVHIGRGKTLAWRDHALPLFPYCLNGQRQHDHPIRRLSRTSGLPRWRGPARPLMSRSKLATRYSYSSDSMRSQRRPQGKKSIGSLPDRRKGDCLTSLIANGSRR